MAERTFREVTDALCLPAQELSKMFDVTVQTVRQYRMKRNGRGYRPPPPGWQGVLAGVARARGKDLTKLAKELERAARAD